MPAVTVRPVLIVGEPVLHRPTRAVTPEEFGGDSLRTLVDDLFETMDAANGVGLAANQIGDDRRVFVFDCPDPELDGENRRGVVVNPVLTADPPPETMPDPEDDHEGCLSVPGESFPTGRAEHAEVRGVDVDGHEIVVTGRATSPAACSTRPTTSTATPTSTGSWPVPALRQARRPRPRLGRPRPLLDARRRPGPLRPLRSFRPQRTGRPRARATV